MRPAREYPRRRVVVRYLWAVLDVIDVERAGELNRAVEVQELIGLVVDECAGRIAIVEPSLPRDLPEFLDAVSAVKQLDRHFSVEAVETVNGRKVDSGLPCVARGNGLARVSRPQQHPRPRLLYHGLGEVYELEDDGRANRGATVSLRRRSQAQARSCGNGMEVRGFVTTQIAKLAAARICSPRLKVGAELPEVAKLVEILGFATPVLYAAATYAFFHWLDDKASESAKNAITGWLKSRPHGAPAIRAAMLEAFDRIYSFPLLSWRSFFRSTIISTVSTAAYLLIFDLEWLIEAPGLGKYVWAGSAAVFNCVSDYISLFLVRRLLSRSWIKPSASVILAPLVGICAVLFLYYLRFVSMIVFATPWIANRTFSELLAGFEYSISWLLWRLGELAAEQVVLHPHTVVIIPALIVHMWLPILGVGVLAVKALRGFTWAVGGTQWFLKDGNTHPYEAVGYVAAVVVFAVAAVMTILGRFLS